MGKRLLIVISAIIAFVLAGTGFYFAVSDADASGGASSTQIPKSLVGQWYQTNELDSGVIMQASVNRDNTIQINMKTRDSSNIYWLGSFESNRTPKSSFVTTSQADQDALSMSIFGSRDSTKKFTYNRGDLSFKFTMLGSTSTVHLQKHREVSTRTPTTGVTGSNVKTPSPKKPVVPKTPEVKVPAAPAVKAPVRKN